MLYLEDSSDLAILRAFAKTLEHAAQVCLERPFVHYISTNVPQKARDQFFGLREAKSDLVGLALFDRLDKELKTGTPLIELMWSRREIENYFCTQDVLLRYARYDPVDDLFSRVEADKREAVMKECIAEVSAALATLGKPDPWSSDIKASDDFMDPLFRKYFVKLGLPLVMRKVDYHQLASLLPKAAIDAEVVKKLDAIVAVARQAHGTP